MKVYKVKHHEILNEMAADIFSAQILQKPASVLGLATGSTPLGLYEKLVQRYQQGTVDFRHVTTFNLDEYCDLPQDHPQSYFTFMQQNLFSKINLPAENINIPNGMAASIPAECQRYENSISQSGGIDLQLLGIGDNGHIGFNEPNAVFVNQTHQEKLKERTRQANQRFFASIGDVPQYAVSMGVGTIMRAQKILLLGFESKQEIIEKAIRGEIDPQLPASILKAHADVTIIYVGA